MTSVIEHAEAMRERRELAALLRKLIENDFLEDPSVQGIVRQVISKGQESLSNKQKYIFDKRVWSVYCHQECWRCSDRIELDFAWDEEAGDLQTTCNSCLHDWARLD